ncbi:hypothetical protein D4S03_06490 [bacterium]|nr:MAG: hypothetical protein D4S03_06490 [bacterium]
MFDSRPVFAFDFLCCSDHEFSLFHPNVTVFDFHTTLTRFHELSRITLRVLSENSENLRFHDVTAKVQCHSILLDDLARVFKINTVDFFQAPQLFQIEVYTDNKKDYASRIIGFFGQGCEFHVIWFDRLHKLYPRTRK